MASKSSKNVQVKRTAGQWVADMWTNLGSVLVALVAGTESAWAGARLLMMSGAAWYEGVGITGTLDIMMIIAAVRMRRKGISAVQQRISRQAMWYGLAMSALTNIISSLVYKGILDVALVGPWVIVAYSPVVVVTLWFVVEMLTHQRNDKSQSAFTLVTEAKPRKVAGLPDSELTPAELAQREARRARTAKAPAVKAAKPQVKAPSKLVLAKSSDVKALVNA